MAGVDPRRLALLLGDLQSALGYWSAAAVEAVKESAYAQSLADEQVRRAAHRAGVLAESVGENQRLIVDRQAGLDRLDSELRASLAAAEAARSAAAAALGRARDSLGYWQQELLGAQAWLEAAVQREAEAQVVFERARQALSEAQAQLRAAESELERARRSYDEDSDGRRHYRDTQSEEMQVYRAQEQVDQAQEWVEEAHAELVDAQAERRRAERRVAACEEAVHLCQQAVGGAEAAVEYALTAITDAERSLDHAAAASRACARAAERARIGAEAVDEMRTETRRAEELVAVGHRHEAVARRAEEDAQCLARLANTEFRDRILALEEYNRPALRQPVGQASGGSAGGGRSGSGWTSSVEIVPVASLPQPRGVTSENDFDPRRMSPGKMRRSLGMLREMMPLIQSGEGDSGEFWRQRDRSLRLAYERGYERVYDSFFGNDRIRLEETGDGWNIINGEHRIWLAQQMGTESLPASVSRPAADAAGGTS